MAMQMRLVGIIPRCHGAVAARGWGLPGGIARGFTTRCTASSGTVSVTGVSRRLGLSSWAHWRGNGAGYLKRKAPSLIRLASTGASRGAGSGSARTRMAFPEKLMIYHAGTGRTTFLACLKVTTIFVFVFFNFLAAPSYIQAGEPIYKTVGIILCGVVPLAFVAYSSAAFVSTITLHLPPFARSSAEMLRRFAANVPPTTRLDMVTMSFIGKPRTSAIRVGDLKSAHKRLGMVNYVRDTGAENKARKWWQFRAVGNFHVQAGNEKKTKNGWVWKEIAATIEKRSLKKA